MKHLILLVLIISTFFSAIAQSGAKGVVTDGETGELLAFVTVVIQGTTKGVTTDFDGNYSIDLSPGTHTLVFSYISYENKEVEVVVTEGSFNKIDVQMGESSFMAETVTIVGHKTKNDEAAVIEEAKKAEVAVSATSSEEMQKKAVNNAQDAVKTVTGVAVDQSGDVNVRGMNARYISVGINGMVIPGTDPEKNSVQIDLIPTSFLNSVAVSKTFSPDLPGNSTGGAIDIRLKDIPKERFFKVKAGVGFDEVSTFNPNYLSYNGGSMDWLGYDDGTRLIPEELSDQPFYAENGDTTLVLTKNAAIKARRNDSIASYVDAAAKSISNQMVGHNVMAPINRSISISMGDTFHLGKSGNHTRLLGLIGGLSYRNKYEYREGIAGSWEWLGEDAEGLNENFILQSKEGRETPNLNSIAIVSFEPWDNHKFGGNIMYNHSAIKSARTLEGKFPSMISNGNSVYHSNTISFMERSMINAQFMADQTFGTGDSALVKNVNVKYAANYFDFVQDEPDLRFFSFDVDAVDSSFYISKSEYTVPSHYWRNLHDVQQQYKADIKIPFYQGNKDKKDLKDYIKFGTLYSGKTRDFSEQTYYVENRNMQTALTEVNGDADVFFADSSMGVVSKDNGSNSIGNYVEDQTDIGNSYTGISNIFANYGMLSFSPTKRWKVIGGVRMENTFITTKSLDTNNLSDTVDVTDFLPAINMIFGLDSAEKWKLRISVSQTVARPTMRETAPFSSFQFIGGPIYVGNPSLRRTLITNLDARLEYYPRRGENITLAAYRKFFEDPIAMMYIEEAANDEITWNNVPSATLYGAEFEFRKRLDFIHSSLTNFDFNTNASYIISEMDGHFVDSLSVTRSFIGQSDYLVNFGLGYKNDKKGLSLNLSGNIFTDRLNAINRSRFTDQEQKGQFQLNFVAIKKVNDFMTLNFNVRNILGVDDVVSANYGAVDNYPYSSLNRARTYSLSLKFDLMQRPAVKNKETVEY